MDSLALSLAFALSKVAVRHHLAEPELVAAFESADGASEPSGALRLTYALERGGVENAHLALDLVAGLPLGIFGAVDYRWSTSATLMDACLNAQPLTHRLAGKRYELTIEGDVARIKLDTEGGPVSRIVAELGVALFVRRIRDVLGTSLALRRVRFSHQLRGELSRFQDFFQTEVEFGAEATDITFPAVLLLEPLLTADAAMAKMLREHPSILSHGLSSPDAFLERVRSTIAAHLAQDTGELFVARVAQQMKMSSRSLQRKLGERRVSFSTLVDEVRSKFAQERLADADAIIADVAFRLGFRDKSSFDRAFRRWTGVSPRTFQGMRKSA